MTFLIIARMNPWYVNSSQINIYANSTVRDISVIFPNTIFLYNTTTFPNLTGLCANEQHPSNSRPIRKDISEYGRQRTRRRCRFNSEANATKAQWSFGQSCQDFCSLVLCFYTHFICKIII